MIAESQGRVTFGCDVSTCANAVEVGAGEPLPDGWWSTKGLHQCEICRLAGRAVEVDTAVLADEPGPAALPQPPVVYLAHPLGGDVEGNAARARRWLRWLMDSEPSVAFCCPWLPFVDVGDDDSPPARARGLRDDVAIAARCDGIVLCGGDVTPGMQLELDAVVAAGGWVADLTFLGAEPGAPSGTLLNAGRIVWRGR
ncbi:MAG: hypothetical protein M3Q39_16805 [Actinomycetota bacterium]|nr:hypothetical protein [Actinomycetota bacterium]